jgi:hypothetical protein
LFVHRNPILFLAKIYSYKDIFLFNRKKRGTKIFPANPNKEEIMNIKIQFFTKKMELENSADET